MSAVYPLALRANGLGDRQTGTCALPRSSEVFCRTWSMYFGFLFSQSLVNGASGHAGSITSPHAQYSRDDATDDITESMIELAIVDTYTQVHI